MEKYIRVIQEINKRLEMFSEYVNDKSIISRLYENSFADTEKYFDDLKKADRQYYNTVKWPNSDYPGVYFIFGQHTEKEKEIGIYIGSSCFKKIGNRLQNHLPCDEEKKYNMNGKCEQFLMELVTSISLKMENAFLAPAIEAFLIRQLSEDFILLNKVGNYD